MSRALLFPSYRGGGFGHIGRCLALAQELTKQEWDVAFVLDGQHVARVESAGYRVLRPRRPVTAVAGRLIRLLHRKAPVEKPVYSFFPNLSIQVVRDGFYDPQRVRQRVEAELSLVRRFKPDVLVGDTWLLTSIVGKLAGLPVVQICKSIVHPSAPNLIWWREMPPGLVDPDVRPVLNPLLEQYGLNAIERAEDLLVGDLLLVPSVPELDPLPDGLDATHYVGPLTRKSATASQLGPPFDALDQERPVVYVTLGGGADPVGSQEVFGVFNEAFAGLGLQVVVSTGLQFSPEDLPRPPANVQYHRWVPGPALIKRSQCVVFHGGYGTTMETAQYGTPSVVVPFHSEQEANGRRLAAAGMAEVIAPDPASCQVVRHRWPYGEFTLLARYRPFLSAELLRETVQTVLSNPSYLAGAQRLQERVLDYDGPAQSVALISTLLG